jgi:hypothetical protein
MGSAPLEVSSPAQDMSVFLVEASPLFEASPRLKSAPLRLTLSARPDGVTLVVRRAETPAGLDAETPAGLDWAAVTLQYANGALTVQLWGESESLLEVDPPHTTETLIRAVDALPATRT